MTADSFQHAFRQAGFVPVTVMRVGEIISLINVVNGGIGDSLLPARVVEFSARIQLIKMQQRYVSHLRITLLLPRNRERDPGLLALAAECRMHGQPYPCNDTLGK